MMKNCKQIFLFLLGFSLMPWSNALALNEGTHKAIQEFIGDRKIAINGFLLDSYLKDQIGFIDGRKEILFKPFLTARNKDLLKKTIFDWLGQGGREEDKPPGTIPYIRSNQPFS